MLHKSVPQKHVHFEELPNKRNSPTDSNPSDRQDNNALYKKEHLECIPSLAKPPQKRTTPNASTTSVKQPSKSSHRNIELSQNQLITSVEEWAIKFNHGTLPKSNSENTQYNNHPQQAYQ
jgi:hypothetical protein